MDYLLKSTKTINFQLQNFGVPEDYVFLEANNYYSIQLSFLNNNTNPYDLVINAKIKVLTKATVSDAQVKSIKVFYFDNDNITRKYVDFATKDGNYLVFDVSSYLFTKKHTHKTLWLENASNSSIKVSTLFDNVIEFEYYKQNQLYDNTNVVSDNLFDYQYSYNFVSQHLSFSKAILDKQLFYNLSFVYSDVMCDESHLFLPNGWNFNVLEYLLFDDGEPVKYIGQDNRPRELVKLDGPSEDYYYTNDGSALILLKENNSGTITYKLFNEISPSYKRFSVMNR